MDKSESELLEDWDVVSSVYDTEPENSVAENKTDPHTGSNTNSNIDLNADGENVTETSVKSSEVDSKEITDVRSETPVNCDAKQTVEAVIVSEETHEVESDTDQATEVDIASHPMPSIDSMEESTEVSDTEHISEVDISEETKVCDIVEQNSEVCAASACTETIEINNQKTEENTFADTKKVTGEILDDSETKNCYVSDEKTKDESILDHKTDVNVDYSSVDNSDDRVVNSSLDSSMEHIQIEHCEGSFVQDVPELIPDLVEQENAAIESSSSDIDIIDENMEESIASSFMHPLSYSISSSVDTSSILTTPSEADKDVKAEIRTEGTSVSEKTESYVIKPPSYSETSESYSKKSEIFPSRSESFQKSKYRDANIQSEPQRPHPQNAACGIVAGILEFLRNMTCLEWSILGGVVLCLYVTIVFNQTNIFAVLEKEDVASQLKNMIDELKHDNKILKDQMLTEMKNEKVFSTFEHQIKELKKENYKLSHMLYDVAKVLEEQKDTHKKFEKREADYIAPFKNEINKLKEHINILKFDNEELQKQLVRMRYSSYSQGGRDNSDKETKKQNDETASTEEIALDINSLKKWNELISLLSKELGLSENDPLTGEKLHSETKNVKWYWKVFLQEFKGTFKDFKANVTSVISDYKKANEKAVSEIYKFVKDFFTVKEDKNQKFVPPDEEGSQWKNIGDFVKDLSEKWTKIKDRIYTSDIKDFVRSFKKSPEADASANGYNSDKRSTTYDYDKQKPANTHFDSERKNDKATPHSRSYDKETPQSSDDSKWMFKRAELRAELRDSEKEDQSENWFLKRKKYASRNDDEVKF